MGYCDVRGSRRVRIAPCPGAFTASIVPPWFPRRRAAIVRPRPVLPVRPLLFARTIGSKMWGKEAAERADLAGPRPLAGRPARCSRSLPDHRRRPLHDVAARGGRRARRQRVRCHRRRLHDVRARSLRGRRRARWVHQACGVSRRRGIRRDLRRPLLPRLHEDVLNRNIELPIVAEQRWSGAARVLRGVASDPGRRHRQVRGLLSRGSGCAADGTRTGVKHAPPR